MEKIILTRQELYELVWSEPLSRLAKTYRISDNGLRKICKRLSIPIPANGFWQKKRYGKPVVLIKLPENQMAENEISFDERVINEIEGNSPQAILRRLSKEIESLPDLPIRVPERLTKPDKLITNTIEYYDAVKRFQKSHHGSYPDKIEVLNIDVGEESRQRALLLMDTLIKALRARKQDVKVRSHTTYAIIESEEIKFRLRERQRVSEIKDRWGGDQKEYIGEFVFVIDIGRYDRKEIKDATDPIEKKIPKMIAMLEIESKRMKEENIRDEILRKKREEEQKIEREFRDRQENEVRAFKQLFMQATRLHQTNILRDYIQTIERNSNNQGNMSEEFNNWLIWAKQKIDWYDPLINKEDSLLNNNFKTNLFKEFLKKWQ